ncbi:MAG: pilin [Patescibacteria group bacterium]
MTWDEFLQFVPDCLRQAEKATNLNCVQGSIEYWREILFVLGAVIAFFFIIYGAFQMVTAFGDEAKYTQAKKTVTWAVVGLIVALLAQVIITFFTALLRGGT